MKGTLILDRTEQREDGVRIFVFEHTAEDGKIRFLNYSEKQMPPALADALRPGDLISAEWDETALHSGAVDKEKTEAAAKEADDMLAKLFAKGKKK
ncbi:MAG: hypothetical protein IJY12_04580 [Clostridia bacterium]|nr:hypothetical protein [Clostridia bacterium]